jgi:hypothetical protein
MATNSRLQENVDRSDVGIQNVGKNMNRKSTLYFFKLISLELAGIKTYFI